MTEELKPCANCGSNEVKFERHIANGHFENIVRCQKCRIRVVSIAENGREKAIQAWNARVQPAVVSVEEDAYYQPIVKELVEALEDALSTAESGNHVELGQTDKWKQTLAKYKESK